MIARIRLFFDATREPLRRRVYAMLGLLLAVGVSAGYLTDNVATTVTALAATALMVPATEAARRKVTPDGEEDKPS